MITNAQIVRYYDSCEVDYINNWHLNECLAIHIGYWDTTTRTLPEALIRQNDVMSEQAGIRQQDVILDAGCGIGGSAIYLAKRYGCRVMGITLSKKQAASAKELSKKHGVEKLTDFQVADFTRTDFPDAAFDVVWALESVCYAASKQAFVNEAYRILKKKGRLILADGFELKASYKSHERRIINSWINRWQVNSLASINDFREHLHGTGFRNVVYRDITKNVSPSARILFNRALIAMPIALLMQARGERTKMQNQNLFGAIYQYLTLRMKLARYGIFYAEKP